MTGQDITSIMHLIEVTLIIVILKFVQTCFIIIVIKRSNQATILKEEEEEQTQGVVVNDACDKDHTYSVLEDIGLDLPQ